MELGSDGRTRLIFLPGFLAPAACYRELLVPIADAGFLVNVPQLYRPTPVVLTGGFTAADEADVAMETLSRWNDPQLPVFVAGHSRGGQAAFLLAQRCERVGQQVEGLVLVDPVDGSGRQPSSPFVTAQSIELHCRALIIGAGRGGRCAPTKVNHSHFARSLVGARYEVLRDLSHADVMGGAFGAVARRLCGSRHGSPKNMRALTSGLMLDFLTQRG